jgi:hypothetical protein
MSLTRTSLCPVPQSSPKGPRRTGIWPRRARDGWAELATATIKAKFVVHVNATEAGLTDQEIMDLLDSEDPTGILRTITVTETGTFSTVETTGQRISGRFTM